MIRYNYFKMNSYKKVLVLFFVFFLSFFSPINALAEELNLPKTTINPDRYLFFNIKRLIEKGELLTKFSKESKINYYKDLTLRRMSELKYVVENKLIGEVEKSTQRLSYQVGILSDYASANRIELTKTIPSTKERLTNYKILLVKLRDQYPANSSYWMFVQHSINSIDLNLEKLDKTL
ncbi:MAG: hypothetical protein M1365_02135 [Actinobacteria bacterium]|nr:hypothetical protein [Actinomycetota bacterium]